MNNDNLQRIERSYKLEAMNENYISHKQFNSLVRNLHLYFGLFISPFILIYSLMVIVLRKS